MEAPEQMVAVLPGVGVGSAFTVTDVVPLALVHPPTVTVRLYVPAPAEVIPEILGFCELDEKLLGPVQL